MRSDYGIPEPLKGSESNSFANSTITVRLPRMIERIIEEEEFAPEVQALLENLKQDIPYAYIRPLTDSQAPDIGHWNAYVEAYTETNWLDIPWFFAETYFYRRILEATQYFVPGPTFHQDPFSKEKRRALKQDWNEIQIIGSKLFGPRPEPENSLTEFSFYIHTALWGNQADLSMWSSDSGLRPKTNVSDSASDSLVLDQCDLAYDYLLSFHSGPRQIDFVLDNIGLELLGDLCLADFFLKIYRDLKIVFHVKSHPTFISDAIWDDVVEMIQKLSTDQLDFIKTLGIRLQTYLVSGRLEINTNQFWTSPLSGWEMPEALSTQLGNSNLVIWKGDANYRRLLGDCHWPYHTPFSEIVSYAPTAFLAIRALKANVLSGVSANRTEFVQRLDPNWMINGKWGLIQFQDQKPGVTRGKA